jgi:transketolase
MTSVDVAALTEKAKEIRCCILKMTSTAKSGHPGGSLSATEIITYLYFNKLRHDPKNPQWEARDRFVLSKGHAAPVLYAVLGKSGYFSEEEFEKLRKLDGMLEGHPCGATTPGVEASTGSLGQGLSMAVGMALAGKLDKKPYRVYALLGDGECDEGQIWEAAMAAAHYKLDNITAFVDRNMIQLDGSTEDIMSLEPLADKWRAFGWNVQEINGHDFQQIADAVEAAEAAEAKPNMIIAKTVKGKGVSFMENQVKYHGVTLKPEELEKALAELGE